MEEVTHNDTGICTESENPMFLIQKPYKLELSPKDITHSTTDLSVLGEVVFQRQEDLPLS